MTLSSDMTPLPEVACNMNPPVGSRVDVEKENVQGESTSLQKGVMLFEPLKIRDLTLHNRAVVSPMCTFCSVDGFVSDFHLVHYGGLALRGAGLIIVEATAVEARGRITPACIGIWSDDHLPGLKRIVDFIHSQGCCAGIQIAHAGRKASCRNPYIGPMVAVDKEEGGWLDNVVGPSNLRFADDHPQPRELKKEEMEEVKQAFVKAAQRADIVGFDVVELHNAHGYLLHSFVSGNSNKRYDEYGGSLENRLRFPLEVAQAVRGAWPAHKPFFVRVSSSDFKKPDLMAEDPEGWDIYQTVEFARRLKALDVDLVDCSSGGNLSNITYPTGPHWQVPFAAEVKKRVGVLTGCVGFITNPEKADKELMENRADLIFMGREWLRTADWVMKASRQLGVPVQWAKQLSRGKSFTGIW